MFLLQGPPGVQRRARSKISIHDRSPEIFIPEGRDQIFSIPGPSGFISIVFPPPPVVPSYESPSSDFVRPEKLDHSQLGFSASPKPTPLNPTPATCHKRKRKLRCNFRNAALQKLHCNIGFSAMRKSFGPEAALQQTKNCTATSKKLRCKKVALSCRFPAGFKPPRLGTHVSDLLSFGVAMLPLGAWCFHQAHFGRTMLPKWPLWAHLFPCLLQCFSVSNFESLGGHASARGACRTGRALPPGALLHAGACALPLLCHQILDIFETPVTVTPPNRKFQKPSILQKFPKNT